MQKHSMYGCYFIQTPALIIRDPELIKCVLLSDFANFPNNMITLNDQLDPAMARNPFFAKDDIWKESRMVLGNNSSGKILRSVSKILFQVCKKFTSFVDEHITENKGYAEFELKDFFARIIGEMVANSAFGIEGQSFSRSPSPQAFTNVAKEIFDPKKINGIEEAIRFCFPKLADKLGLRMIPKETDTYFRQTTKTIIKAPLQSNESRSDFLQYIIERMYKEINEDMAISQAISLFFDGYETSSSALSFVIYHLAENPGVQEKLRKEVFTVLKRFDNKVTYEAIKMMHYLEQVIYESIRLNPPLGEFVKVCNKQIQLKGYDGLRCNLKPGDLIIISVFGLHMDHEFWPNPSKFDPERFSTINKATRNKFTYLGFGEGPRMYIGKRMGLMIVKAVTAIILQQYFLVPCSKTRVPLQMNPNTFASVVRGGLWARFKSLNTKNY
ncbi:cytochrome P450 6a2 [Nasonia vitripennis]|uniref:Cytochrome P450 n=1 Tax=Nasonia vitripennis TaxID=7425 RepID=A0A7M7J4F2_NASVI|nr:cytochrome P450 6a2 [Nasonia vitripennis]